MEPWFSKGLQVWYSQNKRQLPWRDETDPYRIWLSEVILQQTQVVQGLSYYHRFISNYPTVHDLAAAKEDQVLKDWQGLGYYSRARNLHTASKSIVKDFNGIFPSDFDSIRALKGVGDYTAAAIASFAFGKVHAVVDGNVYRLLSRVFGIETPIDSTAGKRQFKELAESLIDKKNPANHNQAIMEFGSQYCKPVKPACGNCIFSKKCFAGQNDMLDQLPVKEKKTRVRTRFFNYLVVRDKKENLLVNKRSAGDIWQGLYEFPLIETEKETSIERLLESKEFARIAGEKASLLYESKTYKHILSHQHLNAKFMLLESASVFKSGVCSRREISGLAFPRLIERFIEESKAAKHDFFD